MKKFRVLSLVMASALCLSMLAGCGNDSTGGDSTGDNTPAPSGSTQETAGTIKIGGIGPLTGDAAVYGMATKQGAEIAIQEINALGACSSPWTSRTTRATPRRLSTPIIT